jgi:hypothetical protein
VAKINAAQWEEIKSKRASGATWEELGAEYGVAHQGLSARFRREQKKAGGPQQDDVANVAEPDCNVAKVAERCELDQAGPADVMMERTRTFVEGAVIHGNSLYLPEYSEQVEKLARLGATDDEIADFFNVCRATISNWKTNHPEFLDAMQRGKIVADMEVADKLYRRATGYSHEAVKIFMPAGATEPVYAEYIEHHPPEPTSMRYWLNNRRRKDWRDRVEVEAEVDVRIIPWDQLKDITPKALEESERQHREIVEGRAARLGLKIDYTSDFDEDVGDAA